MKTKTQLDPYLDIKQLAEYSSINKKKLREMVKGMPHFRVGRKFLVKRSTFDTYMKRLLVNTHPVVEKMLQKLREAS